MRRKANRILDIIAVLSICGIIGAGAIQINRWVDSEEPQILETGDYQEYFAQTGSKVVLFGTSTCPFCVKAREYFADNGVEFADLVVDKDAAAGKLFWQLDSDTVPVILIGQKRINGFSPSDIELALDALGKNG